MSSTADEGTPRPRRRRLSRSAEFERVYRKGASKADRFFVVYRFPQDDEARVPDEAPRLGLSVSRRVGGAVARTRIKRLIREAFWSPELAPALDRESDYVVVARPAAHDLAEREGMAGVQVHLEGLVASLGSSTASR